MTWVRIDDNFASHPKVVAAGPLAMAMQVAALCYCNRELTDGFVPRAIARTLLDWEVERADGSRWQVSVASAMSGEDAGCGWVIDVLVESGMWSEVPGGYLIHGYLDYQPSREQIQAERTSLAEKRAAAGRLGGLAKASNVLANGKQTPSNGVANGYQNPSPVPVPNPVPLTDEKGAQGAGGRDGQAQIPDALALFGRYATGVGLRNGSAEWLRRQRDDLSALRNALTAGIDPDKLEEMARYVLASWRADGIKATPTVGRVLEREAEFDRWRGEGKPTVTARGRASPGDFVRNRDNAGGEPVRPF